MKLVLPVLAAALVWLMPAPAKADDAAEVERWRAALSAARWTGPLLTSTAETLPKGHFYTEPYFFDGISGGDHHPGSSGFYQYGLLDNLTVGVQPFFATGTNRFPGGLTISDFKFVSQFRLSHFTAEHRVPSVALVVNEELPTGKHDRLGPKQEGHGSGSFGTELGFNVQQYFLLGNGRLLRGRINVLKTFPYGGHVEGRSVYGTGPDFRGRAHPGSKTTIVGALEYSLSNDWALALDVEHDHWAPTTITGRNGADGPLIKQRFPASWNTGFAPGIEYNWSPRTGAIFGVWIVPKGHNTSASVTPAIAIQRFW